MIILTDVVADDRSDVPDIAGGSVAAFIADQQKTTFVVVAVVVLDDCVLAVPIRVKPLAVPLALCQVGFVVLNDGIIGAPGPDGDVVAFRPLVGPAHHIVLHQRAIGGDHDNAISADVVQPVVANDHSQTRMPFRAHPMRGPAEYSAAIHT